MKVLHVALSAALALVCGAALAQPAFAPPPPPVEVAPPPPPGAVGGYVLVPGHWTWNGARYRWSPQHWVLRRPGYAAWVPGQWVIGPGGNYRWMEGHWSR